MSCWRISFFFNIWKVCYKICISYNMNCLLKVITNIRFSYMNFFLYFCPLYKCDITTFFRIMVAFILIYECYYSNGLSFFFWFQKIRQYDLNGTWRCVSHAFLAHLSWKFKRVFLVPFCPSVCLFVNSVYFRHLLQIHRANFNQTWHKKSLCKDNSSL